MYLFNFPLSAYSSLLIKTLLEYPLIRFLNLNLVSTFLSTALYYSAVRVQGDNADKVSGLLSYIKLCILFSSFNMLSVRVLTGNGTHSDGSNEESFSEG